MSDVVEITGTLHTPYLPTLAEGLPWVGIDVLDAAGKMLGGSGAQVSGSPLPFRVHIERSTLTDDAPLTLRAQCLAGVGSKQVLASTDRSLTLADALQTPADLTLEATPELDLSEERQPVEMRVIELSGAVSIPAEAVQDVALLSATLLVIQEDGQSNRFSSNLAQQQWTITGSAAPFSLFVDADAVPEARAVKLHIALYDLQGTVVYAGKSLKNLDLDNLPDLSGLVLKLPRR